MLAFPSKLAHYDLQMELGRGGNGVVYQAFDTKTGRTVALKVLSAKEASDRPLREIRAAALLDHPGIAHIYESGEDNGCRYVAMELVSGSTLETTIAGQALPVTTTLDYANQILLALETAHTAGVIHRDLKPSNLMVTSGGKVKIVDFGLAKVTAVLSAGPLETASLPLPQLTTEGSLTGTLAYMSPEQAEGTDVDARSDLFSFGAVLYEMLSGRRAFARDSPVATLVAIMSQEPELLPGSPSLMSSVVSRCLSKDPRKRWQSAADLRFALEHVLDRRPAVEQVKRISRRTVFQWTGAAAAIGATAGYTLARRTTGRSVPAFTQVTFEPGEISTARFGPDGSSVYFAFRAPGDEHFQIYETHLGTGTMRRLDLPPGYVEGVSSKGELALVLEQGTASTGLLARASRDGKPVRLLMNNVHYAAWGPDGQTLMAVRELESTCRIEYPLGTVIAEARLDRGVPFQYANLSHDGRKIAYFRPQPKARGEELCVIDLAQLGSPSRVLSGGWADTGPLHWGSGNDEIWFSGAKTGKHQGLWACNLKGGERCLLESVEPMSLQDIRISDQAALTVSYDDKTSIRVSIGGRPEIGLGGSALSAISDDGGTIMVHGPSPTPDQMFAILVYRNGDRTPLRIAESAQYSALSADGRFVAFATANTAGHQRILLAPIGPGDVRDVSQPGLFCDRLYWFSDGQRLMINASKTGQDRQAFILSIRDGSLTQVTSPGIVGEIVSRDGRRMLIRNPANDRFVMDLVTGQTRSVPLKGYWLVPQAWHVDGKSVLFSETQQPVSELRIMRLDVDTGEVTRFKTLSARGRSITFPAITFDGRHYGYVVEESNDKIHVASGLPANS